MLDFLLCQACGNLRTWPLSQVHFHMLVKTIKYHLDSIHCIAQFYIHQVTLYIISLTRFPFIGQACMSLPLLHRYRYTL